MVEQGSKTAQDSATERFVESLPRRADELEPWVRAYHADGRSLPALSALRRGLQALRASAQRFEQTELAATLQRVTVRLEAIASRDAVWTADDERALSELLVSLRRPLPPASASSSVRASRELVPSADGPSPRRSSRPPPSAAGDAVIVLRVLLVCSRPHAAELRQLLDDSPLQLLHAADPEQALALLHSATPACAFVAAEFATLPDIDLVRRLQTDPLSRLDGVYLLLPAGASYDAEFVRQTGADGVLIEPLTPSALSPVIERATRRRGRGGLRALRAEPAGTVDEIASYVAEEIRTGIADALRAGPDERIQLSDTDALAEVAASAIGRVRSHLALESRGRVRFDRDASPDPDAAASDGAAISLHGTRVLVVDDDPAVLWFFVGLLREAGAEVMRAQDGRDALEQARRRHPHVVLSDILMPRVDGFALCRELRRDVLLQHVPVILLSWKEDLLERARELDAGASGYLRKEARSAEAVQAVATVLQARRALRAGLRAEGEVAGRIEEIGVLALLESVAADRPDARIRVHDAWNMFEVEVRAGQRLALTRTAADGSFARGERALVQLLGVNSGRFSVWPSQTSLRGAVLEPLAVAIERAGKTLAAALDAVSDSNLVHVARLAFDEEELDQLLRLTPTRLHEVVARFRSGDASAQQLLLSGSFTPLELEGHLRELARRGAIRGVWNARGDDLMAAAWREREDQPGRLLHSSTPAANPTSFSSLRAPLPPWAAEAADNPAADGGVTKLTMVAIGGPDPQAAEDDAGRRPFAPSVPPAAEEEAAAGPTDRLGEPASGTVLRATPGAEARTAAEREGDTADYEAVAVALERAAGIEKLASAASGGSALAADGGEAEAPPADAWEPEPITGVTMGKISGVARDYEDEMSTQARDAAAAAVRAAFDVVAVQVPAREQVRASLAGAEASRLSPLTPHEGARVIANASRVVQARERRRESAEPALSALELAGRSAGDRATLSELGQPAERSRESAGRPTQPELALRDHDDAGMPLHAGSSEAAQEPATPPQLDTTTSSAQDAADASFSFGGSPSTVREAADAATGESVTEEAPFDLRTLDPNRRLTEIPAFSSAAAARSASGEHVTPVSIAASDRDAVREAVVGTQTSGAAEARTPGDVAEKERQTLPLSAASDAAAASSPPALIARERTADAARRGVKRSSLREHVQFAFTLAALAAVGYVGQRYVTAHGGVASAWSALTKTIAPPIAAKHGGLETSLRSGTDPNLVAGESLPYIDEGRGVAVAAGQGLLVIEYAGAEPAPRVAVDGRDLGAPPIAIALEAARHELTVQRSLDAVVRSLIVSAGETRIVTLPLSSP